MNKLFIALLATGTLSFAPIGFTATEMHNNNLPTTTHDTTSVEGTTSPQGNLVPTDQENKSKKHVEVNLHNKGQTFKAIIPEEHGKDLNKDDMLKVHDDEHKTLDNNDHGTLDTNETTH